MIDLNFQIIHFHFPLPLKKKRFLDLALKEDTIDHQQADEQFIKAYRSSIEKKLTALEALLEQKKHLLIYFSKSFLDLLEKHEPDHLDILKKYVKEKYLILIGGAASNSLSYLCHSTLFQKELQMHHESLMKYFGEHSSIFINTACLFDDKIAQAVVDANYEAIVASANTWHLGSKKSDQIFKAKTEKNLAIILASNIDHQGVELVNGYGTAYAEKKFDPVDFSSIKKAIQQDFDKAPIYSVSLPISSNEWGYSINQYMNSGLQKAFLNECSSLVEEKMQGLSDDSVNQLLCLLQGEHLLKMRSGNESENYQYFVNSMNILSSIALQN